MKLPRFILKIIPLYILRLLFILILIALAFFFKSLRNAIRITLIFIRNLALFILNFIEVIQSPNFNFP